MRFGVLRCVLGSDLGAWVDEDAMLVVRGRLSEDRRHLGHSRTSGGGPTSCFRVWRRGDGGPSPVVHFLPPQTPEGCSIFSRHERELAPGSETNSSVPAGGA